MKHIGEYRKLFRETSLEQFLASNPPPVFVHHMAVAPLKPTRGTPPETIYRLAVGDTPPPLPSAAVVKDKAFTVLPIAGKPGQSRFLVGCDRACDLFLDDVSVSRKHAWIERRGDQVLIKDNDSTSGTWVNGLLLDKDEVRSLQPADEVVTGGVDLIYLPPADFYRFTTRMLGA